jgi:hypothetical protein
MNVRPFHFQMLNYLHIFTEFGLGIMHSEVEQCHIFKVTEQLKVVKELTWKRERFYQNLI